MYKQNTILRVDLGEERISEEPVPQEWRLKYLGGEGINARLLWEHFLKVDPKNDPLSPDNVLIVGNGPLCATGFGAGSKTKFTYKSPAYNIYGDTSAGGALGAQLRWAGYDHVVITGRARRPVYLWINDGSVEIRDATRLWGRTVHEADDAIKWELGDSEVETAGIGQAGENLVRVAAIMVSRNRAAARGGGGCVFGSKNLKAIAARGTRGLAIHDPSAFFRAMDELRQTVDERYVERRMRYGTLQNFRNLQDLGFNAYRNHQGTLMPEEGVAKLDHNWYTSNMGRGAFACSPGCSYGCGHYHQTRGDESPAARKYAGEWATKPEYGGANPFGMGCDIQDMPAVAHLNKMCNEYSMDTMEIGMGISLLMELWEKGIISPADVARWAGEPLDLEWGNYEAAEKVVEAIALQKNTLGKILGGGVYRAACELSDLTDTDVLKYAVYGKGGATHECQGARAWPNLALACAVASIGGHHLKGLGLGPEYAARYLGKADLADTLSTRLKGAGHAVSENVSAISNSLGYCSPLIGLLPGTVSLELIASAVNAATGTGLTADDLYVAGERAVNLEKAFNSRLGLRREHDTLGDRWLNQPQLEGQAKGVRAGDFLEDLKDEYYGWRGWDRGTSLQTRKKLEELDLPDVAEVLAGEGALV